MLYERQQGIIEELQSLFAAAREEFFEDGVESQFSKRLVEFVQKNQAAALDSLHDLLLSEQTNAEVAGEALRWIGRINDAKTHLKRRSLLEDCLKHASSRVRDGAALGLASMDDPASIPALELAIAREPIPELRQDMIQVLEQLQETLETAR